MAVMRTTLSVAGATLCTALIFVSLAAVVSALGAYRLKDFAERREADAHEHLQALERQGSSLSGCSERGGVISRRPFGSAFCRIAFRDAGAVCTDAADCLGGCILADGQAAALGQSGLKGICKTANVVGGCNAYLIQGRYAFTECVD